jgi:hypothetical protein
VESRRTELGKEFKVGSAPAHRVLRAGVSDTSLSEDIRKEHFPERTDLKFLLSLPAITVYKTPNKTYVTPRAFSKNRHPLCLPSQLL